MMWTDYVVATAGGIGILAGTWGALDLWYRTAPAPQAGIQLAASVFMVATCAAHFYGAW